MVLSEVNAAISLWDRFRKWLNTCKAPLAESVATRFIRLFESHGVHRNQIPSFLGHGLTLKDVQDDTTLLSKLDEPMLEAACKLFAVRREWLDGAESQIHPCHDFYKNPEEFARFLKGLIAHHPEDRMTGVLIAPNEKSHGAPALLILQETIGAVGEKPIYRYHLCNNWTFSYWKARAYLAACVAIAWKHSVYVHGIYHPMKEIERLAEGETLLGWKGEGIWELGHTSWHPEDMALNPDVYLKGIDSELDSFGVRAGLSFWLELEERGLMDAGFDSARQLFQQELDKYS